VTFALRSAASLWHSLLGCSHSSTPALADRSARAAEDHPAGRRSSKQLAQPRAGPPGTGQCRIRRKTGMAISISFCGALNAALPGLSRSLTRPPATASRRTAECTHIPGSYQDIFSTSCQRQFHGEFKRPESTPPLLGPFFPSSLRGRGSHCPGVAAAHMRFRHGCRRPTPPVCLLASAGS